MQSLGLPWTPADFTYHPPDKTPILEALSDPDVVAYFPNAHGTPHDAQIGSGGNVITAAEVKSVLETRGPGGTPVPLKFSFLIHSNGMDDFGAGTWNDALRLGTTPETVVIGVKGGMPPWKWVMWQWFWAGPFFACVDQGLTFQEAYRRANIGSKLHEDSMDFRGDVTLSKKDLC